MGAALSLCSPGIVRGIGQMVDCSPSSRSLPLPDGALVLRVVGAPVGASAGARDSGFKAGDELVVETLDTPAWLEPLARRYKESVRNRWPGSYRFQACKRSWRALVVTGSGWHRECQACVLQLAAAPEQRRQEHVDLELEDARTAASCAHRFNLFLRSGKGAGEDARLIEGDPVPGVRVAAPVGCKVMASGYPAMIPVGSPCALTRYPMEEVRKFVFDGSEDFFELPQAFFHHAAFSSNSKHLVCDIQGAEEEDGGILLLDPCILRAEPPTIADVVGAVAPQAQSLVQGAASDSLATARFDALHPKCSQLCRAFDPHRRSAKRNAGICGVGATCGFGGSSG